MIILLSIFATTFVWIFIIAAGVILYIIKRRLFYRKNFIDVLIRTWTGGKPIVEIIPCHVHSSQKFGEFLYNKKKRLIIRRFDQEVYLPQKRGRVLLDVTASDGYFYANKYTLLDALLKKPMEVRDESEKTITWENKQDVEKHLKEKYKLNEFHNFSGLINPVPHEDRASRQQTEAILNNLNVEVVPWYKNPTIVLLSIIAIGAIVSIVMVILTLQTTTEWIEIAESGRRSGLVDTVTNAITKTNESAPRP